MLKYSCANAELSCIIGNLFTEITAPCGNCKEDNIVICGTAYTGEAVKLVIVADGFLYDGNPDTLAAIRERRCIFVGK
jgi:hypothetical protein